MLLIYFIVSSFIVSLQTPYLTSQKGTALDISFRESFEGIPFITAILTNLGFYILLLLGYINQLLFTPKVAKERHRDVSVLIILILVRMLFLLEILMALGSLILTTFFLCRISGYTYLNILNRVTLHYTTPSNVSTYATFTDDSRILQIVLFAVFPGQT